MLSNQFTPLNHLSSNNHTNCHAKKTLMHNAYHFEMLVVQEHGMKHYRYITHAEIKVIPHDAVSFI